MNDIERAARAVIEAWDRPPLGAYAQTMHEAVSHLRSALAHAARGEAVRSWRDVEGTLPARRDGDKVARVDEVVPAFLDPTPPPATGEAERCENHGREGCIDCEPATGEAVSMDAVRDAWRDSRGCPQWGWDDFREAIRRRALPEAREGGGK